MNPQDIIAIAFLLLGVLAYLIKALYDRKKRSHEAKDNPSDDFFFAMGEITPKQIGFSVTATYAAFATVFFWFIALGGNYSWLLFLIPLCLFLGNAIFVFIVSKLSIPVGPRKTITQFVRENTHSRYLQYLVTWIIAVFLFSAVLVEIVIGSSILASMVPNMHNAQVIFFSVISIVVISYVVIGGLRTVIKTDFWQVISTSVGVCVLFLFILLFMPSEEGASGFIYAPEVNFSSLLAFVVSVFTVQFFGPLCQLQNWQRIAGSSDRKAALKGHLWGTLLGTALWSLMIICALLLYPRLNGQVDFNSIFSSMKQSGVLGGYVFYPLLFLGLVAALISTADSAMVGIFLNIYETIWRKNPGFESTIHRNTMLGGGLFLIMLVVYLLNQTDLKGFAITIIYFLFNQLLVIFPVLLFIAISVHLSGRNVQFKKLMEAGRIKTEINLTVALFVGWITVLLMSSKGYISGILNWTMFASVSGIFVCVIVSMPAWSRIRGAWKKSSGELCKSTEE